ncbi:MAG: EVE domain-containing protein [Thermomicrobiales bacterium]|nr:EVE domain-containing protein [Thermomicrobiales bacterium]MCO5222250.1 EVE domain-containing protein [Thermomicrobiales bacterium]
MTTLTGLLPALTGNEGIWIFQSNLPHFSIAKTVDTLQIGDVGAWYVQEHADELRGGDLVLLWEEGANSGLYALGTLVGDPYEGEPLEPGGARAQWIRWRLDAKLDPPVSKAELQAHDVLKGMRHFDRKDTTCLPVTSEQWAALKELLHTDPSFAPVVGD